MSSRHVRIAVCAAGSAGDVGQLIDVAHERSWTAEICATVSARDFLDIPALERLTGGPVRSSYEFAEGNRRVVTPVDALIVAPATFNTVNKIACGVADSYVLTSIAELIGNGVPTVVVPFVNVALASRAPFRRAVDALRAEGVRVLGPDEGWQPHPTGAGAEQRARFPWRLAFDLVEGMVGAAGTPPLAPASHYRPGAQTSAAWKALLQPPAR